MDSGGAKECQSEVSIASEDDRTKVETSQGRAKQVEAGKTLRVRVYVNVYVNCNESNY